MDRRSFLMSAAVAAALCFTGCKGSETKPADEQQASSATTHQCACPEGQCGCDECKAGDTANCACGAPSDAGGSSDGAGQ